MLAHHSEREHEAYLFSAQRLFRTLGQWCLVHCKGLLANDPGVHVLAAFDSEVAQRSLPIMR